MCSRYGLPRIAVESIVALNIAECDAIARQCSAGPNSYSSIFIDTVIGDQLIHAGAFIMAITEVLNAVRTQFVHGEITKDEITPLCSGCVQALQGSKRAVYAILSDPCPMAEHGSFTDPRPTLTEAWFLSLQVLLSLASSAKFVADNLVVQELVTENTALFIRFMLCECSSGERRKVQPGVSMDGPQTLAMFDFLTAAVDAVGSTLFSSIALSFQSQTHIDFPYAGLNSSLAPSLIGGSILCAALFRGFSGSLPPWTLENAPNLYASLFVACENNIDSFCRILEPGAEIKLSSASAPFQCILPGDRLAGPIVQTHLVYELRTFLSGKLDWRHFKVLVKAACGGKKKTSIFANKPAISTWDCDRV